MKERRKAPRFKEESDVTITVVSEGKHQKIIYDSSIIEDKSYEIGVEFVKKPDDAIKKLDEYISWKRKHINQSPFED